MTLIELNERIRADEERAAELWQHFVAAVEDEDVRITVSVVETLGADCPFLSEGEIVESRQSADVPAV